MKPELLNFTSDDGSRLFADLPQTRSFKDLLYHAGKLEGLLLTNYLTDQVSDAWIDFRYEQYTFSINGEQGDYLFFANDANTPDILLENIVEHFAGLLLRKVRIAFYGGTFDPVHSGHLAIGESLPDLFSLDKLYFMPAYHAPHKADSEPTPAYHRIAMIELAIAKSDKLAISTIEIDHGKRRYTYETLAEINKIFPNAIIYFVMGADSWQQITSWKEWEMVLALANHIIVSRPGYEMPVEHVPSAIRRNIIDVRGLDATRIAEIEESNKSERGVIYFSDAVSNNISATQVRDDAADGVIDEIDSIPMDVAKYIEKYELYKT